MHQLLTLINDWATFITVPFSIATALLCYKNWAKNLVTGKIIPTFAICLTFLTLLADLDARGYIEKYLGDNLEMIADKSFSNTEIYLDGKNYTHCKFTNVTFVYGGSKFSFTYNQIYHGYGIRFLKPEMQAAAAFLGKLDQLRMPLIRPDGSIEPPGITRTP